MSEKNQSVLLFNRNWRENNWIHTSPKGISGYVKCNMLRPGFELVSPYLFSATISLQYVTSIF